MAMIREEQVKTLVHLGCALCGQHMFFWVEATFHYHDSGVKTYEFGATPGVGQWYKVHVSPHVIGFRDGEGFDQHSIST